MKRPTPERGLSRIEEARARIEHLAYHDPLTGLPNRLLLMDRLSIAISRSVRAKRIIAVFFLDLDNFKPVNDRLGHVGGDGVLREVASRLASLMREEDTLARLGGDEFVAVAGDLRATADVDRIAEKILTAVRRPFEVDGHDFFLTASIGVSIGQGSGFDGAGLIHNADAAMYRAKEAGRNRYEVYTPELGSLLEVRRQFESSLRSAIAGGELALAYQPIIELARGVPVGVEALVRWPGREPGPISPAELIAGAEETGLIVSLGRSLLEMACRQAARWRAARGKDLELSVNVSPFQLLYPGFPAEVARILEECSYFPPALCLEVSDRTGMGRFEECLGALGRLKSLGVRIAIDDFGAGASSFRTLHQFPFDVFKIDPSFVHSASSNSRDGSIAKSIVRVGHLLGTTIVAEGVETAEQLEFLKYHRCDRAQGWLFAPAVDPRAFEREYLPKMRE